MLLCCYCVVIVVLRCCYCVVIVLLLPCYLAVVVVLLCCSFVVFVVLLYPPHCIAGHCAPPLVGFVDYQLARKRGWLVRTESCSLLFRAQHGEWEINSSRVTF